MVSRCLEDNDHDDRHHEEKDQGADAVRARLKPAEGPPRLLIHRRCTHLIEALEKYHYSEKDLTSMDPVKDGPDHAADALRYLVLNLDKPYPPMRVIRYA